MQDRYSLGGASTVNNHNPCMQGNPADGIDLVLSFDEAPQANAPRYKPKLDTPKIVQRLIIGLCLYLIKQRQKT